MTAVSALLGSKVRYAGAEITAFGAWWAQELREAWGAVVQRWAPARSQQLVVDLAGNVATISKTGAGEASIVEFPFAPDAALPALKDFWPDGAALRARAKVILPASAVLLGELRLPAGRETDVRHAVELQLETKLPLSRDQLHVDWRVREKLPDQSRIVAIAAIRREFAARMRDGVQSWGWRVVAMTCTGAAGEPEFNLLPPPVRRLSFHIGRRERYLSWSACALAATVAVLIGVQWWVERARSSDSLEEARQQVASVRTKRATLASGSKPLIALYDLMRKRTAADAIVELSRALPQDTWIYQADARAGADSITVTLEAYTPVATTLLQALEQLGRFESIELADAGGAEGSTQRVQLVAKLQAGAAQ